MVTCANCTNEAIYTYPISETFLIHYCQYHLPKFLTNQKRAGQLPLIAAVTVSEPEVSDTVEAEVIEEPVVEEAAPKTAGTSKKTK